MRSRQFPIATIGVLAATAVLTALQLAFPGILLLLERTPSAISQHQWWRLITPLFVHPEGWRQIAFNFTAIFVVGALVERAFGSWRWVVLYFISGVTGEIAGYAWKPMGGGASVAGAGLLGALAVWLIVKNRTPQATAGGIFVLLGAAILTFLRDIHGPSILIGAGIGWAMLKLEMRRPVQQRGSI